ncbi:extracellular serine-rich protein [Histoplasma ohiense]|nr:extracellular serine-rich protein [Histoplasma ohiense (nom. inval.)]
MKSIISTIALIGVASAATIDVNVGDKGLNFNPDIIKAKPGDDIVFHFFPRNHDVTEGKFDAPCAPSDGGFYSGLINADGSQPDATFTVRINNTNPIWLYCSTPRHCQGGMSAVINPPDNDKTLDAYKSASKEAKSVRPDQVRGGIFSENGGAKQSGTASWTASDSPTATVSGTGTGTGAAGSTTSPGAASALFSEGTALFNVFAAVVAGGAGLIGLL